MSLVFDAVFEITNKAQSRNKHPMGSTVLAAIYGRKPIIALSLAHQHLVEGLELVLLLAVRPTSLCVLEMLAFLGGRWSQLLVCADAKVVSWSMMVSSNLSWFFSSR